MAEHNQSSVFRQKSLDSISSPEQLTDSLRVTHPGIWAILAAVIILLGGMFAWSALGRLETVANGKAVVKDGTASIMVTDMNKGDVQSGMPVRIGRETVNITSVETDDYGRAVAYAPVSAADGKYDVEIVTESIHPISFLFS